MKIRQARKILNNWAISNGKLPAHMQHKLPRATRRVYRHNQMRHKKRARSCKSYLARDYPAKVWIDEQFLGYATSITFKLP